MNPMPPAKPSKMVRAVADAMLAEAYWPSAFDDDTALRLAKVAIARMRNPTKEMISAMSWCHGPEDLWRKAFTVALEDIP